MADPTTQKKLEIYNANIAQISTFFPEIKNYVLAEDQTTEKIPEKPDHSQIISYCILSNSNLLKNYFNSDDEFLAFFGK